MCHNLLLPDSPACSVRHSHATDLDKENISNDEVKPKKKRCYQLLEIALKRRNINAWHLGLIL
jgi:hypothetical protein